MSCALRSIFTVFRSPWNILIIEELFTEQTMGFNQLAKNIKYITPKTLSEQLSKLEYEHIITKEVKSMTPFRVSYQLTDKGKQMQLILTAIKKLHDSDPSTNIKCDGRMCSHCPVFQEKRTSFNS